jgi:glycosyltransferase involved in cell wall biosynthesis
VCDDIRVSKNFKHVQIYNTSAIKYIGQSGTTGYASAAKGYIADYILKNVPISWQTLKFDNSKNDTNHYVDVLCESVIDKEYDNYDRAILHSTPDLWESFLKQNRNIPDIIGYCTWETNKLPKSWVNHINLLPEVWVPSSFNKECFLNSGVKSKIKVVPHVWHPQKLFNKKDIEVYDHLKNKVSKDKYTFYSIGELNFRKGIEDLVCIFDNLNDQYPDTQLILKIHYKDYSSNNKQYCINEINKLTTKVGKSVHLLLDNLNNKDIIGLHSFGDCYVSLNKGEGFGLTVFDAFNYNKKIITTAYGGQIEYLGTNYSGLVKYKLNKVNGMETFSRNYTADQEWGYPDLNHAYELMSNYINK